MDAYPLGPLVPPRTSLKDVSHKPRPGPSNTKTRTKKRSPNYARPKPASPEVISSLISSLEAISNPARDLFEYGPSISGSRSPPSIRPSASKPSTSHSVRSKTTTGGQWGMDYGAFDRPKEDEYAFMDDAAEPPTVRTARPPSGLSPLTARALPKLEKRSFLRQYLQPTPEGSRGSRGSRDSNSLHSRDASDAGKAEKSLVGFHFRTLSNASHSSDDEKKPVRANKRLAYKRSSEWAMWRVNRQMERDRAAGMAVMPVDVAIGRYSDSTSRDIVGVQTPSPRKRRLVRDSTIDEEPTSLEKPKLEGEIIKDSPKRAGKRPVVIEETGMPGSPSFPAGMIPRRSSSLHHKSSPSQDSSTSKRTGSRKSSRQNTPRDKPIKEEVLAKDFDSISVLDEEHDTMKRIRELQARKELRLKEAGIFPEDLAALRQEVLRNSVVSGSSSDLEPDRIIVERSLQPAKAHKVLGLFADVVGTISQAPPPTDVSDRSSDKTILPRERRATNSLEGRPASAASFYHHAPDPQDVGHIANDVPMTIRESLLLPSAGHISPLRTTPPSSQRAVEMNNKQRWSHPDLSLDFDVKYRQRRSMSEVFNASRSPEVIVEERTSSSRDSIDDAVDGFLLAPRLSQRIRHPQTGRVISFSEVGDPNGSAVFVCVGMGLTRYVTAFYDDLAYTLKLRLITLDRPGVGASEPHIDRSGTPLSWPEDILATCEHLKIRTFSILAHSAGAIYALATALRFPHLIRGRVHLLAPWIPPSQMSPIGYGATKPNAAPVGALPRSQRFLRILPTPFLKAANSTFMGGSDRGTWMWKGPKSPGRSSKDKRRSLMQPSPGPGGRPSAAIRRESMMLMDQVLPNSSNLSIAADGPAPPGNPDNPDWDEEDEAIAAELAEHRRRLDERLTLRTWDMATTHANPAVDLLVCLERHRDIGFRYVDITRPVVIRHGSRDTRVPVENVKWLGRTMRSCEVRVLEGEGHGLMASAVVMGGVLEEIAQEWAKGSVPV
ncbi:hypothetical protein B0A49_08105 [Cryomyces minteri]|uniref:AB hydrolase-1 domain-containing protein n=1 Tax=Cryomyces minteri TaxID=331657 RepID=A0A4U0WPR7_9PEZI|nr:hypothetical protein B0A49_08105 [Cryomyces minteri]